MRHGRLPLLLCVVLSFIASAAHAQLGMDPGRERVLAVKSFPSKQCGEKECSGFGREGSAWFVGLKDDFAYFVLAPRTVQDEVGRRADVIEVYSGSAKMRAFPIRLDPAMPMVVYGGRVPREKDEFRSIRARTYFRTRKLSRMDQSDPLYLVYFDTHDGARRQKVHSRTFGLISHGLNESVVLGRCNSQLVEGGTLFDRAHRAVAFALACTGEYGGQYLTVIPIDEMYQRLERMGVPTYHTIEPFEMRAFPFGGVGFGEETWTDLGMLFSVEGELPSHWFGWALRFGVAWNLSYPSHIDRLKLPASVEVGGSARHALVTAGWAPSIAYHFKPKAHAPSLKAFVVSARILWRGDRKIDKLYDGLLLSVRTTLPGSPEGSGAEVTVGLPLDMK